MKRLLLRTLAVAILIITTAGAQSLPPPTVIPLDDAAKVKVLTLLRQQDKLLMQKRDYQLRIGELDAEVKKLQDDINQVAQDLAKQHNIDTVQLVLDLDRLAWISKELPK